MRLVVADDSMLLREGLARLLADAGFDVVGKAEDASRLLRRVELTRPDVAIVDIKMPPTHTDEGIAAAQEIRRAHPKVGVLVLSQYLESRYAMRLLQEAPDKVGYLLKDRVSTSPCSPMPSSGSTRASASSTRRSSRGSSSAHARRGRSTS